MEYNNTLGTDQLAKISAFIITCDRPEVLGACVKRVRFADEVLIVDKSRGYPSVNQNVRVAAKYSAVRIATGWSPVVEDTRRYAEDLCEHDWIICLDDDEILSKNAGESIRQAINSDLADIFRVPLHQYICGWFDPLNGIENKPSVYKRGKLIQSIKTQGFPEILGTEIGLSDIWIDHLSHPDIHSWIEKANRYTSIPDRQKASFGCDDIVGITESVFSYYCSNIQGNKDPRREVIAVLKSIYAMVDGLKDWWQDHQPDGHKVFKQMCEEIEAD